jgi:serine protease Do
MMRLGIRRILTLVMVFATAFIVVTGVRAWRAGGSLGAWMPSFLRKGEQFRPETFTLPNQAPLALGEVELLSRLNDEYAKLTAAVVPSVVSINTAGSAVSSSSIRGVAHRCGTIRRRGRVPV